MRRRQCGQLCLHVGSFDALKDGEVNPPHDLGGDEASGVAGRQIGGGAAVVIARPLALVAE